MSVWMYLLVAPKMPLVMTHKQFSALIGDLVNKDLVAMPCAILGGNVSADSPLGMGNAALNSREARQDNIDVYYKGDDSISLLRTLSEFPYGQSDLCIWFNCFNWNNPDISRSFGKQGCANADVLLYALAKTQTLQCYDAFQGTIGEEHEVQFCLRTAGKNGPWDIAETPLEPLLKRHFGPDLIVDCSYS